MTWHVIRLLRFAANVYVIQATTLEVSGSADDTQELAAYYLLSRRRGENSTTRRTTHLTPTSQAMTTAPTKSTQDATVSGSRIPTHSIVSHRKFNGNYLLAAEHFVIDLRVNSDLSLSPVSPIP